MRNILELPTLAFGRRFSVTVSETYCKLCPTVGYYCCDTPEANNIFDTKLEGTVFPRIRCFLRKYDICILQISYFFASNRIVHFVRLNLSEDKSRLKAELEMG